MKSIIFNTEMVRARTDGRKTQTRRVIKPQPTMRHNGKTIHSIERLAEGYFFEDATDKIFRCPYGKPGDKLWVKEKYAFEYAYDHLKPSDVPFLYSSVFLAAISESNHPGATLNLRGKWRSARFMPRWASRTTIENTSVRMERVQDISEEDAIKEGAPEICDHCGNAPEEEAHWICEVDYDPIISYQVGFERLWNSINKKWGYSWKVNPWVWVIEFKEVSTDQHHFEGDSR